MAVQMYDFIVIGSGSSGGTLARNLLEAGAHVLLLEAGKFFRHNTFPKNEADYSAQLFWGGGLEFDTRARTAFLRAKCVGGTTIVNQCLMDRFDDLCLEDWRTETGIDWMTTEKMGTYYEQAESRLVLRTFEQAQCNRNAQLFTSACDSLGYKWKFLRRGESDCQQEQGNDCIGCLGGCYRNSKQSSLVSSIEIAEQKGLQILSEFEVDHIVHQEDKVTIYGTHQGKKTELITRKVCLAAGSFGTTQIMLKSGFGNKLPYLGKGFTQHPQYMFFGLFDAPVDAHKGAFQTVASADPNFRKKGFKLENVYAQPISVGMLFNAFGVTHQQLMKKFRYYSCMEVAIRDEAVGKITIDKKGKLLIDKILTDQDKKRRADGIETLKNIFAAQGAKEIIESPFYFGLHLMGGCAIGTDPKKSVVNPEFTVHGFENIYIADTSIYPGAPGINPSLSAMAFSMKLSELLIRH